VEAGREALAEITSRDGLPPLQEGNDNSSPSIAELIERQGEPLPSGLVRLFVALKLGSLGQGMSGVRWRVLEALADCLTQDVLPLVPAGDASDRIALANLFGVLTGTGEALRKGKVRPAHQALKDSELLPLNLNPRERHALLSGTHLSTAAALAGLFEAERVFQSALVAAALSSVRYESVLLPPRVYRMSRQSGQIEVAAALRELIDGRGSMEESTAETAAPRGDAHVMGACLDILRQAAATLERASNAVTENELVLWQSEEIIAGATDLSAVALSADLIALALRVVGDLSEARTNVRDALGQSDSGESQSKAAGLEAKASTFMAEIRDRAHPAALDPSAVWRLAPMIGKTALVIAIEILAVMEDEKTSVDDTASALDTARNTVRNASHLAIDSGVAAASNLASVAMLIGSGALVNACGVTLPSFNSSAQDEWKSRLGGYAKRT
jgi:histidine ammonia-lyase